MAAGERGRSPYVERLSLVPGFTVAHQRTILQYLSEL